MENPKNKPVFLGVSQAAQLLGISKGHCSLLVKSGKIPSVRIGCWPKIPAAYIDHLAAQAMSGAPAAAAEGVAV